MCSNAHLMKYVFATTGIVGKKLQDFGHRVTAIEIYMCGCLTVDCVLLVPDKFGQIFIFSGGTDIESTLQHHLILLQNAKNISQIADVHVWHGGHVKEMTTIIVQLIIKIQSIIKQALLMH